MRLEVECGALTESPVYCSHKRGKNWCATIAKEPTAPGGLARQFWTKARGDYFYIVPTDLAIGTPVEFGADYYTCGGSPQRKRWYGFVTAITGDSITLQGAEDWTGPRAIKEALVFSPPPADPNDPINAAIVRVNSEGAIIPSDGVEIFDPCM